MRNRHPRKTNTPRPLKGASLIELLIVIALLGIFLGVFLGVPLQLKKGRDAKHKIDLQKLKTALYDYYFDAGCFPETLPSCGQPLSRSKEVYLQVIPCDAKGGNYVYEVAGGCSSWFRLFTHLEIDWDRAIDEIGCRGGCGPQEECNYNYGVASSNKRVNEGCIVSYACTSSGSCAAFTDPEASRCPMVFENDPTCQGACGERENRCHDERGKRN